MISKINNNLFTIDFENLYLWKVFYVVLILFLKFFWNLDQTFI
jgi:hypothetical protein